MEQHIRTHPIGQQTSAYYVRKIKKIVIAAKPNGIPASVGMIQCMLPPLVLKCSEFTYTQNFPLKQRTMQTRKERQALGNLIKGQHVTGFRSKGSHHASIESFKRASGELGCSPSGRRNEGNGMCMKIWTSFLLRTMADMKPIIMARNGRPASCNGKLYCRSPCKPRNDVKRQ